MTFLYTSRAKFDNGNDTDRLSWSKFIGWSKLTHLTELVSLDTNLNELLFEPDRNNEDDWKEIISKDYYETGFFRTLDYVLQKTSEKKRFNLLAVVIEPEKDCSPIPVEGFDFLGYELLDQYYNTSALSNCGGFDETFSPGDLNTVGLIDGYEKAVSVKRKLLENNPMEEHADTNVIAVWRHRIIGR